MSASDNTNTQPTSGSGVGEEGLPPQRHAGQVGYGPNYQAGASLEDKIAGLKEEIAGKVTRNPGKVQHGHDLLSGEEKRKKLTGEDEPNPFQNADTDDEKESTSPSGPGGPPSRHPSQSHSQTTHSQPNSDNIQLGQPNISGPPKANPQGMAVNQGYGHGAKEQAATVAPEGTKDAHMQRQGEAVDRVKHIG